MSVVDRATVKAVEPVDRNRRRSTPTSRDWSRGNECAPRAAARRDEAIARLHALLLRAARFEVARRRPTLPHLRGDELDDIATEAADDALMSVLRRLDDFRGASRFTTWAYKFALLEAAVKLRKRAWQGREIPLEPEAWDAVLERRARAGRRGRAERAARDACSTRSRGADAAPATRPRRAGAERRADRRPRRAPEHEPRRALQDPARRAAEAAQTSARARPRARRLAGGTMTEATRSEADARPAPRPGGPRGRLRRLLRRARPLRRARARRRGRRRGDPRPARAPRRLPRLPRGAREPLALAESTR